MDELRLVFRFFLVVMLGYVMIAHFAVDNAYIWFNCQLPDPVDWLWQAWLGLY